MPLKKGEDIAFVRRSQKRSNHMQSEFELTISYFHRMVHVSYTIW